MLSLGALTRPTNYNNDSEVPITPTRELTYRAEGARRPLRLKLFNYPPSHNELSMRRERFFGVVQCPRTATTAALGQSLGLLQCAGRNVFYDGGHPRDQGGLC